MEMLVLCLVTEGKENHTHSVFFLLQVIQGHQHYIQVFLLPRKNSLVP